jgi:hypothetical protein
MSEMQERTEREMFEFCSHISPDINDLLEHIKSRVAAEHVKQTIRQPFRQAAVSGKANLKAKQQDLAYSAKRPLSLLRCKISNGRGEWQNSPSRLRAV